MEPTLLVVGATGLVGKSILHAALKSDVYTQVIALTRRPVEGLEGRDGFVQHIVDFDNLEESRHLIQARDIVNAMGTTHKKAGSKAKFFRVDHDYPLEVATIARDNGAERCINISSVGAGAGAWGGNYLRVKKQLEDELRELAFPSYVILRPSLLLGDREEKRAGEDMGKWFDSTFRSFIPRRYRGVHAHHIAQRVLQLGQSTPLGNQIIESEYIPLPR